MALFIEIDCVCGATLQISDAACASGEPASCSECGAEFLFETSDAAPIGDDRIPGRFPGGGSPGRSGPLRGNDPAIADPALRCPSCGGGAEIVYRGPRGRDRMLACPYCRSEIDLPEVRGSTHERIRERPGEKIVERVTQWEGMEPELEGDGAFAARDGAAGGGEFARGPVRFELNGRSFDSREDFERHLREVLPEGLVQDVFDQLDRNLAEPSSGVGNRTCVYEYSSVETERLGAGGHADGDREIPADTLAKIRKLFKRRG